MAEYVLNADALRVVQRNDKGGVTYRKRYKRGDVVDTSKIDEAQVKSLVDDDRLVEKGSLPEEGSQEEAEQQDAAAVASSTLAASGGATGDLGSTATQDPGGDPEEEDEGDRYDGMSYPELQAEAKQRTDNGGGSADELRERLRAADKEDSEENSDDDE